MTTLDLLRLAGGAASWVEGAWTVAGMAVFLTKLFGRRLPLARHIHAELKPFYLPACVIDYLSDVANAPHSHWFMAARVSGLCLNLVNWWMYKDITDDDDRWKRRRRKLAATIKRAANGKLVAEPA